MTPEQKRMEAAKLLALALFISIILLGVFINYLRQL